MANVPPTLAVVRLMCVLQEDVAVYMKPWHVPASLCLGIQRNECTTLVSNTVRSKVSTPFELYIYINTLKYLQFNI